MVRKFPLNNTSGAQIITLIGGDLGFREIALLFATAPSAGTVTIEERGVGSTTWETVNAAAAEDITAGELTVFSSGAIADIRVTFTDLAGGADPVLWVSSQPSAMPLLKLMTDNGTGPNARLRVDLAQTSFFAGREFRAFKEFPIATTTTYVIEAVVPINTVLFGLSFDIEVGAARITTYAGSTPSGTFSEVLPIFPRNTMTEVPAPAYESQITLTAGGAITGGTLLDVLRVKSVDNTNKATTIGNGLDERGIAPGAYYFKLELLGVIGVLRALWEERPNRSQLP